MKMFYSKSPSVIASEARQSRKSIYGLPRHSVPRNDVWGAMAFMLIFCAFPAFAQQTDSVPATTTAPAKSNSAQPIEITATETVEWLRNEKKYIARENVIVTQGTMQIFTDLLTADYRDGATSSMEIWQLTAQGNVEIKDETNTAYGDLGVYDVTKGVAVLTGKNLRMISPDQTVTARDRMEYYSNERMAKAIGNAKVVRAQDTLAANTITAFFKDEAAQAATAAKPASASPSNTSSNPMGGGGNLDRLEADGNVVITTPTEILRGNKGIYRADTNTAEITGNVKIERGESTLEGTRAEINLTTNVSKMFGSEKQGGRVRGIFFPGSDKQTTDGKKPATAPKTAPKVAPALPSASTPPISVGPENTATPPAPEAAKVAPATID